MAQGADLVVEDGVELGLGLQKVRGEDDRALKEAFDQIVQAREEDDVGIEVEHRLGAGEGEEQLQGPRLDRRAQLDRRMGEEPGGVVQGEVGEGEDRQDPLGLGVGRERRQVREDVVERELGMVLAHRGEERPHLAQIVGSRGCEDANHRRDRRTVALGI